MAGVMRQPVISTWRLIMWGGTAACLHKGLVEGLGVHQVARDMGLSRTAVYPYLAVSAPGRVESPGVVTRWTSRGMPPLVCPAGD